MRDPQRAPGPHYEWPHGTVRTDGRRTILPGFGRCCISCGSAVRARMRSLRACDALTQATWCDAADWSPRAACGVSWGLCRSSLQMVTVARAMCAPRVRGGEGAKLQELFGQARNAELVIADARLACHARVIGVSSGVQEVRGGGGEAAPWHQNGAMALSCDAHARAKHAPTSAHATRHCNGKCARLGRCDKHAASRPPARVTAWAQARLRCERQAPRRYGGVTAVGATQRAAADARVRSEDDGGGRCDSLSRVPKLSSASSQAPAALRRGRALQRSHAAAGLGCSLRTVSGGTSSSSPGSQLKSGGRGLPARAENTHGHTTCTTTGQGCGNRADKVGQSQTREAARAYAQLRVPLSPARAARQPDNGLPQLPPGGAAQRTHRSAAWCRAPAARRRTGAS